MQAFILWYADLPLLLKRNPSQSAPPSGLTVWSVMIKMQRRILPIPGPASIKKGKLAKSVPFAPKAAVLWGYKQRAGGGTVTLWSDRIQTNPALNATQTWELWNWTVDGHPIHLHLVGFKVVNREVFDPLTGALSGTALAPEVTEAGWKDTAIAYPARSPASRPHSTSRACTCGIVTSWNTRTTR